MRMSTFCLIIEYFFSHLPSIHHAKKSKTKEMLVIAFDMGMENARSINR